MVRGREGGVEEESEEWLVWSEEGGRGGGSWKMSDVNNIVFVTIEGMMPTESEVTDHAPTHT